MTLPRPASAQRSAEALSHPPEIDPARDALFLDIDGTLAPLAPRPEDVQPLARRTALLRRLSERLDGRLAVVTGRTIVDADRILDNACAVVAGVHGLEIRQPCGTVRPATASPAMLEAVAAAAAFVQARPGMRLEDKGAGLTLHYRQAPHLAEETAAFGRALASSAGLKGQAGDMVFEVREAGGDKGLAVAALMELEPFRGARPIFVGDDVTDEDGIRAAQAGGGHGVLVGDRDGSNADYRLADVEAVLNWLEEVR